MKRRVHRLQWSEMTAREINLIWADQQCLVLKYQILAKAAWEPVVNMGLSGHCTPQQSRWVCSYHNTRTLPHVTLTLFPVSPAANMNFKVAGKDLWDGSKVVKLTKVSERNSNHVVDVPERRSLSSWVPRIFPPKRGQRTNFMNEHPDIFINKLLNWLFIRKPLDIFQNSNKSIHICLFSTLTSCWLLSTSSWKRSYSSLEQ